MRDFKYLCFQCHSCKEVVPFVECGEKELAATNQDETFSIRCPRCGAMDDYQLKDLQKHSEENLWASDESVEKKPPIM
jgi:uncharacterized C2H2 Zn-finger protein